MIPARRPQGGHIYGRSRGSEESDWNGSGGIVVNSYLYGGNFLRISHPGGRLIDALSDTDNGYTGGCGSAMNGLMTANLLAALQVNLGWPLRVP